MAVNPISCPKCQASMRSIERNGVIIDQCTACGGIYLDRGELEKLMDAEGSHNESRGWRHNEEDEDDDRGRAGRRRGGFMGGMFGGGED